MKSTIYYFVAFFVIVALAVVPGFGQVRRNYRNRKLGVQRPRPGYGKRPTNPCDQSSCYPATGNLLTGREDRLKASSSCGLDGKEKFCIVSHLMHRKKCFWCDSQPEFIGNPRYSHRVQNVVTRLDPRTGMRSWWQSENGKEEVSVQLDLEAEFHFTHMIITFRTFRPAAMLIERSYDYGKTWKVYRYFAYKCEESFPGFPTGSPSSLSELVCEERYSAVEPSHMGEVIFRVLQPYINIKDPYSDEVQNLLKITNLRVNFTKLHTLGDQLLDTREEIKEKYYYAIYDMVVRGSCSCYGHASRCLPLQGVEDRSGMVHGRCECTHNTKGFNCEECKDFYNDLPWRPAIGKETNACKRCECNRHASRCHFDENVYMKTGNISGGVCDGCQHNTEGRNCQSCIPFYYQDQSRSSQNPDICQPCNCDSRGSLNDGLCDSRTDAKEGLVAGRCHCRANVDGLKCDRCKAGFWNFTDQNPEGCQACSCHTLGTVNNLGCDEYTGACHCKRNVIGRDCNQCLQQHYGLSDHPDGCLACNCDKGGAYDKDCDVIDGQCRCRPHVTGRQCDRPDEGFFVPYLNYLTFEAELAKGTENCQVVMREPPRDGRPPSFSGVGFMRVFDNSKLEFDIENVESSLNYDLVINYEPQFRGTWDGMKVRVERPEGAGDSGPCKTHLAEDTRTIKLSGRAREKTVFPTVCLESGKSYKIILEFTRSNNYNDEPSASILIDSIMLIPRAEELPFYKGSRDHEIDRQEYQNQRCSEPFYTGQGVATLPEVCVKNHLDSIGFYVFKQSFSCHCDGTGSRSSICEPYGGQCDCKPNVKGRRCNRCSPGTFGFGPEGCSSCDCSSQGALDNFCDQLTGKCKCRPNTYGRQCNECQPGFWNFPNCERCQCNGHADSCSLLTGACIKCRDHTTGENCSECQEGFYGDPHLDVGIACRACPCPGTKGSGHSFASVCHLDPSTKDVICDCQEGYGGDRCNVCAENYFGSPETPGGSCARCDCSDNVDISRAGNCDSSTGECLQCLHNTAGERCHVCKSGFYGDAPSQQCRVCSCNILGTNATKGPCDATTGQCQCHPNVMGPECDRCSHNHWKLASGVGCEACGCDPIGSFEEQCNEYNGQCRCKSGFGGRQCNQCQTNFFGNPRIECLPCNCDRSGSLSLQCNHETGQCVCSEGMGGLKCNQCARGFRGRAPYCHSCGECFDNWDYILDGLKDRTRTLIDRASKMKQKGATGAYKNQFSSMDEKLTEVEDILLSANMTSEKLYNLDIVITELRLDLDMRKKNLDIFENGLDNTTQRISLSSNTLANLRVKADELKNHAGDLKVKATQLQEANVEGALNLTRAAGQRSQVAQVEAEYTEVITSESLRKRKQTENILIYKADRFNRTIQNNEIDLTRLGKTLREMEDDIPDINEKVCDRRGDPCDSFCGGAGCGKCGGLSCNDGLVNVAQTSLGFAKHTEKELKQKETNANELLRGISFARQKSDEAFNAALLALQEAMRAQNSSKEYRVQLQTIITNIEKYFNSEKAKPDNIKDIADQILDLNIKLRPEQIAELSVNITLTIQSLTNIDFIIDETRNDLATAIGLKERADRAKKRAEMTLDVAQRVVSALNESAAAQDAAEQAISGATDDIATAEGYLTQIVNETSAAHKKAEESRTRVIDVSVRVDNAKSQFSINERHLTETTVAVDQASLKAQKAKNDARDLEDKYLKIEEQLAIKSKAAEDARRRAEKLKSKANKLSAEVIGQLDLLKDLRAIFEKNEITLNKYHHDISSLETRMQEYHEHILTKATFYTTCT